MALYIFIFHFDDEDPAVHRVELEFDEDLDAVEAAKNLAEHYKIDVWRGEQLVAQVQEQRRPQRKMTPTPVSCARTE